MSFSTEWNQSYADRKQLVRWPWSDLVSYVMRYIRPEAPGLRVLELGFGAGGNIRFFKDLGARYHGIEGSQVIVEEVRRAFPEYAREIVCGDFTSEIPFSGPFDLIVDRSSLTHNSTRAIQACLGLLQARLAPGGAFVGIDWFSTAHSGYKEGKPGGDAYTRTAYEQGQFKGVGHVHFSDKDHLEELFAKFSFVVLEHKTVRRDIPKDAGTFAAWNFVAKLREGKRP